MVKFRRIDSNLHNVIDIEKLMTSQAATDDDDDATINALRLFASTCHL